MKWSKQEIRTCLGQEAGVRPIQKWGGNQLHLLGGWGFTPLRARQVIVRKYVCNFTSEYHFFFFF